MTQWDCCAGMPWHMCMHMPLQMRTWLKELPCTYAPLRRYRHSLGVALLRGGKKQEAVEALEMANEKDPMNVTVSEESRWAHGHDGMAFCISSVQVYGSLTHMKSELVAGQVLPLSPLQRASWT